jgi:Spy/CpxP family protein refolding chaperone
MKPALKALAIATLLFVGTASTLAAQPPPATPRGGGQRQGRGPGPGQGGAEGAGGGRGEVQRMFDAYTLVQAQEQLKIGDDQFAKFMPRFKALQGARRQMQVDRMKVIVELRRLAAATPFEEAKVKDQLRALQELDARAPADLKKSYESIDQVLDVRQQAQFRVFEEVMERRKLDLVMRARQANRAKPKPESPQ